MKPLKVSSTLHTEQEHFLQEFEPTLKSEVEKMGGQLEAFYSRHNPGVVQAYSVKFSDSPVGLLFTRSHFISIGNLVLKCRN